MRSTKELEGKKVFIRKTKRNGTETVEKLGRVRWPVFSEDGERLVGFVVHRPDIVGMIKRPDAFLAFDAFEPCDGGIIVLPDIAALDDEAKERLGVDWENCMMWVGMDVATARGKELGYIGDAEYDEETGVVSGFLIGDGNAAQKLVGQVRIPSSMITGYRDGKMIVKAAAAKIEPSGGAAAVAGEGYARAKEGVSKAGKKAGKAAGDAFDKGTRGLGKLIGKAKRAVDEALEDDIEQDEPVELEDVLVEEPPRELKPAKKAAEKPKTYAPKSCTKKPAAKKATQKSAPKKKRTSEDTAKAVGKHIGKLGGMFSAFKEEYDKASK